MSRKFKSKPLSQRRARSGFTTGSVYGEDLHMADTIKPTHLADILSFQYQPATSRQSYPDPPLEGAKRTKKPMTDRDIEKRLSNNMLLTANSFAECEAARKRGDKVFTQTYGERCHMVEVFFEVDLDKMSSKQKTIFETDHYLRVEIPAGAVYAALDCNLRRLFVHFNKGIETVYGSQVGQWVVDATTWNIEEYIYINPPELPNISIDWDAFLLSNPWDYLEPWNTAGVYHWGCWRESEKDFCLTTDTIMVPPRVMPVLHSLTKTLGNMTRAHRILLGAVDKDYRDKGERMITDMRFGLKFPWVTDERDCFSLRTCMVNVQTDPYYKEAFSNDEDAWLVMSPLGVFKGGELCVKELGRKFPHYHGTVGFIRVAKLEYRIAPWSGTRYSLECLQSMQIPEWAKIKIRRPRRRAILVIGGEKDEKGDDDDDDDDDRERLAWVDASLAK